MITKKDLISALTGIEERKLTRLSFVNHLENWGSSYIVEVHRIAKKGESATDFILSSFLFLDEGNYCEDLNDLEALAEDCHPCFIDSDIVERVNQKTRNRIAFIFDEIEKVNIAVELFDDWNRYCVLMETEDDYISIFALIPE